MKVNNKHIPDCVFLLACIVGVSANVNPYAQKMAQRSANMHENVVGLSFTKTQYSCKILSLVCESDSSL